MGNYNHWSPLNRSWIVSLVVSFKLGFDHILYLANVIYSTAFIMKIKTIIYFAFTVFKLLMKNVQLFFEMNILLRRFNCYYCATYWVCYKNVRSTCANASPRPCHEWWCRYGYPSYAWIFHWYSKILHYATNEKGKNFLIFSTIFTIFAKWKQKNMVHAAQLQLDSNQVLLMSEECQLLEIYLIRGLLMIAAYTIWTKL